MQFKLKSLEFELRPALLQSLSIHAGFCLSFFLTGIFGQFRFQEEPHALEIEVIQAPHSLPKAIQIAPHPPKKEVVPPLRATRAVFGVTRRSITSDSGVVVKAGNTLAKTPDRETLNASDADSLPVPTEEYLVSEMPTLAEEVRIPYPPDSKKKGIEGAVVMDLLIDQEGRVREAKEVQSPADDLRDAALAAVKNFKFKPAKIQNKPVAVRIRYAYRFIFEP